MTDNSTINEETLKEEETLHLIYIPEYTDKGKRFVNYLFDLGFMFILGYAIGGTLALLFPIFPGLATAFLKLSTLGKLGETLFGLVIAFIYYFSFEMLFGITFGKIITGTKVITDTGQAPGKLRILFRTLGRFIPFDALSFLFGSQSGWHDSVSGTAVVDDSSVRKMRAPLICSAVILLAGVSFWISSEGVFTKDGNSEVLRELEYEGIALKYPDNWKVETNELDEGYIYQVNIERTGMDAAEVISLVYFFDDLELEAWLSNSIESFKEEPVYEKAFFSPIKPTEFQGLAAFESTFRGKIFSEEFFGEVIVFSDGYISALLLKQAGSMKRLKRDFDFFEAHFRFLTYDEDAMPIPYDDVNAS